MKSTFSKRVSLNCSAEEAYRYHARPGALMRMLPPWKPVEVVSNEGIETGAVVRFKLRTGPLVQTWNALHTAAPDATTFVDVQTEGPFKSWEHTHAITTAPGGAQLEDRIEYELPGGPLGRLFGGAWVRRELERTFAYRHRVLVDDLDRTNTDSRRETMRILMTGSTGLVGTATSALLSTAGHEVVPLVRRAARGSEVGWDPAANRLDPADLEGFDAVVHLAGESISKRWSDAQKRKIRESRVAGTKLLSEALAATDNGPRVLLSASAIGFYGDRGSEVLDESSSHGAGFLAGVCQEWEAATARARDAGMRVVTLRTGVVLSPLGGALAKMLTPFKLGAGGKVGSGEQYMSWITLDDVAGSIAHALETESLSGPVNLVAPAPVTNAEFTRTLGKVLKRPTLFPMPAFAARLAFGEMADELLLGGANVRPKAFEDAGYAFRYPDLEGGLRHVLGR